MNKSYSEQYEDIVNMLDKLQNDSNFARIITNDVLNTTILGAIGQFLACLCDEVRALRKTIEEKE